MQKSKIEWTDYTWNPVMGICPVGCWYCYARRMYKRFRWMDKLEGIDEKAILMKEWELYEPAKLKKPSKIFVCSTIELFHPEVKFNTGAIFNVIKENPQHTFQILTKFPQNIDRPMPDNVWLGVTVTNRAEHDKKIPYLFNVQAKIKFISFEPMLEEIYPYVKKVGIGMNVNWAIIGRLTGYGKKHDPKRDWIDYLVDVCKRHNTKVFLKDNLKEIWGEPLIQEFPDD